MPSLSQSVRACSRRWSKYCMFSACSGAISRSMNASMSASTPGRCAGRVKSTLISLRAVENFFPDYRQGCDGVLVADFQAQAGRSHDHGGEVLEQQRDGRRRVLRVELGSIALLLGAEYRGGDHVHAETPKLVLHSRKALLSGGQLGDGDHD